MKIWRRLLVLTLLLATFPAFAQVLGGPVVTGNSSSSGGVTGITAGSSNIVLNPSTITTTGTVDLGPNPTVTGLTASTVTTSALNVTGTCQGCFTPVLQPLSVTTTDTTGTIFPYTYFDSTSTGAVALGSPSWGLAASATNASSLRWRFLMPPTLPGKGALNFCSLCLSAATTGVMNYAISDADIATNNTQSVGGTVFTTETGTSITWTAANNYVTTCTPLTEVPVANHISAGALTVTTSGYTLGQIGACNFYEEWK